MNTGKEASLAWWFAIASGKVTGWQQGLQGLLNWLGYGDRAGVVTYNGIHSNTAGIRHNAMQHMLYA